ncbi:MAG: DNA polymerase III subunit gamma/tau [Patescibacteria group bacterium]|nr:DNA polymerase III subunit gamma/tau [Patescibacteria group bacterium]MBU1953285.1 DNA polymerase III subunit gamma/tau [Patescibacteria group bacterium]
MFYTKYRPQKFSEVCRPNEAADVLSKQLQSGKTVHAYLFVGPRGTGKTTLARILAKSLNCLKPKASGEPCDKCSNCESIKIGSFVDLIEIDAASNRGIDDIRQLKDRIKLAPTMGKKKVYIIDEVHMLTTEAFNALLKTLEEPPRNTNFILCTTEDHKVPATIKSRCQVFRFKRASVPQILEKLKQIVKSEEIKISDVELKKIAEASLGGFRDAETLLQQVAEGEISVDSLLSTSSKEKYIECVDLLIAGKASKALDIISDVYGEGIDLYVWVGELLKYLRTLLFVKSGVPEGTAEVTDEIVEATRQQAKKVEMGWLIKTVGILLEAHKNIRSSFIPQLPVELAVVEICGKNDDEDVTGGEGRDGPEDKNGPKSKEMGETKISESKKSPEIEKALKEKRVEKSKNVEKEKITKPVISLKKVMTKWDMFVKKSRDLNHSLTALLNSSKPVGVEGNLLILEVFYPFHKERLESMRTRKILEDLSKSVFGICLGAKCVISADKPKKLKKGESGILTDMNISIPVSVDKKSILEAFDGGLPIVAKS